MIDTPALRRAMIVGTVLLVALAFSAHVSAWITLHALLFGGMLISAAAGYLYALDVAKGYAAGGLGGAIAGGVCGFFGIALSIMLGDTDPSLFTQNALIYAFTGGVGGVFGQFAADLGPVRR